MNITPEYWTLFINENNISSSEFDIPESNDLSSVSATFTIMDAKNVLQEATECYPGCIVIKDGYVPVGACEIGSGDPYFININDGPNGKLYRIYHDCVLGDNYSKDNAVAVVLEHYEDMLKFRVK